MFMFALTLISIVLSSRQYLFCICFIYLFFFFFHSWQETTTRQSLKQGGEHTGTHSSLESQIFPPGVSDDQKQSFGESQYWRKIQ